MNGTGTQTDPYIPATWDEFVTAVGKSGVYVSLPEGGGTFDMNEIAPEGGIMIEIKCTEIQGNDWVIKNAYNISFNISSGYKKISRLHFLNFYHMRNLHFINNGSDSTISECKFSGISTSPSSYSVISNGTLRRCSFNFKLIDKAHRSLSNLKLYFCKVAIDHSDSTSTYSEDENMYYYNCFFEHKTNANNRKLYFAGNSSILHSDAGNYILSANGEKISVTEDQLKDAAYLQSIGFPIAGD